MVGDDFTELDVEYFLMLKLHEGWSTGEIAIELDYDRETVKNYMRLFDRLGLGEYTIFDGMWHFWFSPTGNDVYERIMKREEG